MTPAPEKKPAAKKRAPVKRAAVPKDSTAHPRFRFWTDRRITAAFALGGVVFGVFAATSVGSLRQSRDNNTGIDSAAETLAIIKDSVDPDGRRFQEGQARTAAAVSAINEISVLAAYCAKSNQELIAIQGCVRAEYVKMHPTTTTTP